MNTQATYTEDEIRQGMIAYAEAVKKNPKSFVTTKITKAMSSEQLGNGGADYLIGVMNSARKAAEIAAGKAVEQARARNAERQSKIDKMKSDASAGIVPFDDDL